MDTKAKITTFHDAKGNTVKVDCLIPIFSRKRSEESRYWFIYSPHLNTIGFSNESEEKAIADFKRALRTFFNVHNERGTLEKALLTFGWTKEQNTLIKPKFATFGTPVKELNLEEMAIAA